MRCRRLHVLLALVVCLALSFAGGLLGTLSTSKAPPSRLTSSRTFQSPTSIPVMMIPVQLEPSKSPSTSSHRCVDFTSREGTWVYVGNITEEQEAGKPTPSDPSQLKREHLLHWYPSTAASGECRDSIVHHVDSDPQAGKSSARGGWYRRFDTRDAQRCLRNKTIVLFGNSNTRTLYIALESLLRDIPMMSRTAAKQLCDNSRTNHHCWTTVRFNHSAGIDDDARRGFVTLKYFSYTKGLFDEELPRKMLQEEEIEGHGAPGEGMKAPADLIIGNSGLNSIQNFDDKVWEREHASSVPKLKSFIVSILRDKRRIHSSSVHSGDAKSKDDAGEGCEKVDRPATFIWHLSTPICENQPHFRRYRYNAKHWRYRSVEAINKAVARSNAFARRAVEEAKEELNKSPCSGGNASDETTTRGGDVLLLDGWSMLVRSSLKGARDNAVDSQGQQEPTAAAAAAPQGREKDDMGRMMVDMCPYFDDPLHHRFMDREMAQALLNLYCP